MARKPWQDKEALRELYVNQDKTINEIADHFGVAISTVWRWLDKYGFDTSTWDPAPERFDANYRVDEESECWEWTGPKGNGYGTITINYQSYGAHRYSYRRFNGPIPDGAMICHKCHNRSCVNPDHLYAGDAESNAQDAINIGDWNAPQGERNGRASFSNKDVVKIRECYANGETLSSIRDEYGGSLGSLSLIVNGERYLDAGGPTDVDTHERMATRGEDASNSKLTEQEVREIRERYEPWETPMADLADEYNVSTTLISDVVNRNIWKHIE